MLRLRSSGSGDRANTASSVCGIGSNAVGHRIHISSSLIVEQCKHPTGEKER